jgi:hypothetical protein
VTVVMHHQPLMKSAIVIIMTIKCPTLQPLKPHPAVTFSDDTRLFPQKQVFLLSLLYSNSMNSYLRAECYL